MNELVGFLRARLDEDEMVYRHAMGELSEDDLPTHLSGKLEETFRRITALNGKPERRMNEVSILTHVIHTRAFLNDYEKDPKNTLRQAALLRIAESYSAHPEYQKRWA
ncbi:DUF6221 family protein [Saccharopolyspora sp. NPDC002376]